MLRKRLFTSVILLLCLCAACHQEPISSPLDGYFYSPDAAVPESPQSLYLDGVYLGRLPYMSETAGLSDPALRAAALHVRFLSGDHLFEVRDKDSTVVVSAHMRFMIYKQKRQSSVYCPVGGAGSTFSAGEVVGWFKR